MNNSGLKVLIEEVKIFKPKVIFATSNPYSILKNWKAMNIENKELSEILKEAVIVKLPHPANRDSYESRYLKNTINIIKGLSSANIIKPESDEETNLLMNAYKRYKLNLE